MIFIKPFAECCFIKMVDDNITLLIEANHAITDYYQRDVLKSSSANFFIKLIKVDPVNSLRCGNQVEGIAGKSGMFCGVFR